MSWLDRHEAGICLWVGRLLLVGSGVTGALTVVGFLQDPHVKWLLPVLLCAHLYWLGSMFGATAVAEREKAP